jgi:hypothetical protein
MLCCCLNNDNKSLLATPLNQQLLKPSLPVMNRFSDLLQKCLALDPVKNPFGILQHALPQQPPKAI